MHDQSERLRRMTQYSWHVLRADSERERASLADDGHVGEIHDELAELHLLAAEDLSDAWRDYDASRCNGDGAQPLAAYRALFGALYGPEKLEKAQALIPAALFRAAE
jgi:hypothetical protein